MGQEARAAMDDERLVDMENILGGSGGEQSPGLGTIHAVEYMGLRQPPRERIQITPPRPILLYSHPRASPAQEFPSRRQVRVPKLSKFESACARA